LPPDPSTAAAKSARWGKTWIVLGYSTFVLLVIEISLRIFFAAPALEARLSVNDDYSWRRAWVRRQGATQDKIFYSFDRYHPMYGWATEPNLRDVPVFGDEILNTNSRGLRGAREFPYERTPGQARIIILGDSFAFGDEVSDDETFAAYLQTLLPEAEVINMGVHGYGHDQMLLLFLEEGLKYGPDMVVLGFLPADMERNLVGFRDYAKPRFIIRDGAPVLTNSPVPPPEEVLRWDWARPRLIDALSIITTGVEDYSGARERQRALVTELILDQLRGAIESVGAVPIFVYLPFGPEVSSREHLLPGERVLFDYCAGKAGLYCFSTRPYFRAKIEAGVNFEALFHWDPIGHQTVAEGLFDFLVNQHQLLPR